MPSKRNFSAKREAIYAALSSTAAHPSAEWIYDTLKTDIPDLSLGTVYRNLSMFKQNGKIRSLGVFNGHERFDYDTSDHAHFVCERCFDIRDIQGGRELLDRGVYDYIGRQCGAVVTGHNLLFFGLCRNCADDKENTLQTDNEE